MVKGITPTRARRRQSDAKWRASVAMCYEIMKHVIPRQKLGRKKLSKALTLKETERHIVCLERKLKELIQDKAPMLGKVVMAEKENSCVHPASFEDIRKDFAVKQLSFFASNNTGSGKKRYNVPADIEASFDNLSRQSSSLVVMNRGEVSNHGNTMNRGDVGNHGNHGDVNAVSTMSTVPATQPPKLFKAVTEPIQPDRILLGAQVTPKPAICTVTSDSQTAAKIHTLPETALKIHTPLKIKRRTTAGSVTHTMARCDIVTPKKTTPKQRSRSTSTESPWSRVKSTYKTPSKACKQLPFGESPSGFTPVKLPLGLDSLDQLPTTPAKSLIGSPFSCFSTLPETPSSCFNGVEYLDATDDEEVTGLLCPEATMLYPASTLLCPEATMLYPASTLLCTESSDNIYLEDRAADSRRLGNTEVCKTEPIDLEEESFYPTLRPESGLKPKVESKCRRRLDSIYQAEKMSEAEKSTDRSCLEFDSYLVFHRHHASDLNLSGSPARKARGIARMWESLNADERATYASIATLDNSDDSNGLSDDLIGIDLKPLMKTCTATGSSVIEKRGISEMSQEVPDMLSSDDDHHFHLVPEYEDLGIIYSDRFQKETSVSPMKRIKQELPEDSQVVPHSGIAL